MCLQARLAVTVIMVAYVLQQRHAPFVSVAAVSTNVIGATGDDADSIVHRVQELTKQAKVSDARSLLCYLGSI